jgi:hypothetical protein
MTHKSITICMFAGLLAGCSSVSVIKDPGPEDTGIRYYRPKPYLLVTPADATGRMVKLKIEYLPDYSEEYSVHPKGKKPPQVQLKDGWNLVAVGGPAPPEKPDEAPLPTAPVDPMKVPEYVVAASNVPIGLYEAVFDTDGGKKYLKGWRYVGFSALGGGSPIGVDQSCARGPNSPGWGGPDGSAPGCPTPGASSSIPGPLYGLVFFNGVMTFRQLDEIANNMTCPQYLKPIPEPVKPVAAPPGAETTPERPRGGGTQTRPETPRTPEGATSPTPPGLPSPNQSTSPTAPGLPSPNPSTSSTGGGKARSASSPGDEKVTRTSDKIKIPPPRVGDLTK